ncbi:MAG: hypothetical protein IPJ88_10405 [Myxococcales bacterium]|nr:MAG: hypothetical protein IPJ88_10405 [Myxococcales bacterium]
MHKIAGIILFISFVSHCSNSSSGGTLDISLEAETTITSGLQAGTNLEDIQDGWQVQFDNYLTLIGDITVKLSTDQSKQESDPHLHLVDLKSIPSTGLALWQINDLDPGRWEFHYRIATGNEAFGNALKRSSSRCRAF